ncbi:MAG: DUF1810 family protein [Rhodoferax sp.]|uniref:DUF1810 family protein n=1 Tax=Rhodoferax sp. TaxID=50421 RepID=UPI003C761820
MKAAAPTSPLPTTTPKRVAPKTAASRCFWPSGRGKHKLLQRDKSTRAIFHSPDDLKFRSCMTQFHLAAPRESLFQAALSQFFGGEGDVLTLESVG